MIDKIIQILVHVCVGSQKYLKVKKIIMYLALKTFSEQHSHIFNVHSNRDVYLENLFCFTIDLF